MYNDDGVDNDESKTGKHTRLWRVGPLAVALASLTLLAAACSGGSASPGVAGSGSASSTTSAQSSSSGSAKTGALAYSQCMRSHGVSKFPDPNSQGGINITAGNGVDPSSPQFQAADKACKSLTPTQNQSPAQQGQAKATNVKYSQCMRSHGISDFPDPSANGGLSIQAKPGGDLDPNSPQYQSAAKTCQQYQLGGGKMSTSNGGSGGS